MVNVSFLHNKKINEDQSNTTNTATEALWRVTEVANYLRLTPETVRMMARQSKIPSIKMGRSYRFRSEDIRAWLESHINSDH